MNRALRILFRAPILLYRAHCGWLLGHRFLVLVHTGRRTGLNHWTVLEVMDYRSQGPEFVVMSGFGRNADWLRNIQATPELEIVVGTRRFVATVRFLDTGEAVGVVAGYERRHRIATPLVRAVLNRLLGWHYDGSDCARRRLIAQLPLVAFRPKA